jgi:CDP-glycerol glycerophosphotransferase (TagB/SpsB family)
MKGVVKHIVGTAFSAANWLVPKRDDQVVVTSFPDFDDNTRLLSDALAQMGYQVTVLTSDGNDPPVSHTHIVCPVHSVKGVLRYMTSRWVFYSHGLFGFAPRVSRQTVINLWHGMPIKAIGRFDGERNPNTRFDFLISENEFYQGILSQAFGVNTDKIIVSPAPRNGLLTVTSGIREQLKMSGRLVVWLPTFRTRKDGIRDTDGLQRDNVTQAEQIDFQALNTFLIEEEMTLLIKPHPAASQCAPVATSNIITISEEWLSDLDVTLYQLLGESDGLITDISSVYTDFKSVGGHVVIYMEDRTEYLASRPLSIPRYEDVITEPVCDNLDTFISELRKVPNRFEQLPKATTSARLTNALKLIEKLQIPSLTGSARR